MMKDNVEIAINYLMKAIQIANDEYEIRKERVLNEFEDFSDWCYLIKELENMILVCKINDKIHKQIEELDELKRFIEGDKYGKVKIE